MSRDPVKAVLADEEFEDRLKELAGLDADGKRRALKRLESAARRSQRHERDQFSSSFDRLECPTDVPVMPMCGSVLPSERMMWDHRKAKRKGVIA